MLSCAAQPGGYRPGGPRLGLPVRFHREQLRPVKAIIYSTRFASSGTLGKRAPEVWLKLHRGASADGNAAYGPLVKPGYGPSMRMGVTTVCDFFLMASRSTVSKRYSPGGRPERE